MALSMTRVVKGGLSVANAYHKVNYISGNKDMMHIDVKVYKDATEAAAGNHCMELSYSMDSAALDFSATTPFGGNNIKQAYDHLKSLDEYSAAVDC